MAVNFRAQDSAYAPVKSGAKAFVREMRRCLVLSGAVRANL
jgi:hypothetical protein